ncbi:MAG TPA: ATP-binding protein [Usitatibacteraceae bacterium]|nr:ATP-binding protein [Usitatibacteraceae bacterium]
MKAVTTRTGMFVSRQDSLRDARGFLERFCSAAGVARQPCLKLNLVVEELFLNTVKHGHRGGSDAPVWITLAAGDGAIRMTYEDRAPPFNPFAEATREMLEALAGTRREGGLGVLLAHGLATETDYAYLYGRNRIRLTIATPVE